jgi:hypothetical protein
MAIIPNISTSGRVADAREGTLALVAKPEPGETLDLVAIVTSVILTRVCAVAGPPEMAALRYGSISAIGNRVTIVTCGTFADSVPALRRVRR